MGCGAISKPGLDAEFQPSKARALRRLKTINNNGMFIEDIDDIKNTVANRRNTVHFDLIKLADSMLNTATTDEQKSKIYAMKGDYYYKHADNMMNESNLDYFVGFRKSLSNFTTAHDLDLHNKSASLGIAKCLISLCKYSKALKYLEDLLKCKDYLEIQEFWLLYGISLRKCAKIWNGKSRLNKNVDNLDRASQCLHKALNSTSHSNMEILKEKKIVDNLLEKQTTYKKDIHQYMHFLKHNASSFKISTTRQHSEKELFKILSIDGGGLRGMIPSLVLSEIEKRSKCYMTDIFDMLSGSSTGGILTAMCTIPERLGSTKPFYSMSDIMNFYLNCGKSIFSDSNIFKLIFSQKYSNQCLYDTVNEAFKGYYLSQTLNSIIIPALNCDGPLRPEYFTNYDARCMLDKDYRLVDVVMATTAAPTVFPPYKIKGVGCFIDGSLSAMSMSKKAYEEAMIKFKRPKNDIFVLSLGTGEPASEYFEENYSVTKSFLHWTANTPNYIMVGQQNNSDIFLRKELGRNYKRFQIYLERDIPLDSYDYLTDLCDIATEYIEEKTDEINKVVEVLLS